MISRSLIIASLLLSPVYLFAQQGADAPMDSRAAAHQELETIINEAGKLDDKYAIVNVRSRAALLVSFSDPSRSETMFLAIWKFTNEQTDAAFDKEQARLLILKYLFSRNPKLARRLLSEQTKRGEPSTTQSRGADPDEEMRMAGKLASQLLDTDPSAAAGLLEKSLSMAITSAGVGALSRLRERDPFLSDYVATKVLEGLVTQPTKVSLPGLFTLAAYMFPGAEAPIASLEAESSLQLLQYRYFLAGWDVLGASLTETPEALLKDPRYAERDLPMRAAFQAQVAAILAALAPRFHPSLAPEITVIAGKLSSQVPPNMAQMTRLPLARLRGDELTSEDPQERFALALSKGDFDEARKQLDRFKDGEIKDIYTQLVIKNEARALLAKSEVMEAVVAIRKLEDRTTRLVMYLDALKAAKKKRDADLTSIVINEARLLIPQIGRNGIHVRALLSFATQMMKADTKDDAMEFLSSAVISINALGRKSTDQKEAQTLAEAAMAELNNPKSLLDAPEMEQAFSSSGLVDLDRSLAEAKKIELKPVQLVARLETLQGVIRRKPPGRQPPARPAKASSNR